MYVASAPRSRTRTIHLRAVDGGWSIRRGSNPPMACAADRTVTPGRTTSMTACACVVWHACASEVVDDARRQRLAVDPVDAIDDEAVATGVLLLCGARRRTTIVKVADHDDLDWLRRRVGRAATRCPGHRDRSGRTAPSVGRRCIRSSRPCPTTRGQPSGRCTGPGRRVGASSGAATCTGSARRARTSRGPRSRGRRCRRPGSRWRRSPR